MTFDVAASTDRERVRATQALADATKNRVPGTPVNCLPHKGPGYVPELVGDVVLFKQNKELAYVSRTDGNCNVAAEADTRLYLARNVRVCRGSVLEIRQTFPSIRLGACKVTSFIPYMKEN